MRPVRGVAETEVDIAYSPGLGAGTDKPAPGACWCGDEATKMSAFRPYDRATDFRPYDRATDFVPYGTSRQYQQAYALN